MQNMDYKLNILKAIAAGLVLATMFAGCSTPPPPPTDPVGVIDLVPGQQPVTQPPASQVSQPTRLQERNI